MLNIAEMLKKENKYTVLIANSLTFFIFVQSTKRQKYF